MDGGDDRARETTGQDRRRDKRLKLRKNFKKGKK